jgi:protein-S-isoprenylcysteine O-methyltransferase Ste14
VTNRKSYLVLGAQIFSILVLLSWLFTQPGPRNCTRCVGASFVVVGLALVFTARFQLGRAFSVTPQARILVTHGLYSKIRNPIYVFSTLVILGLILIFERPCLWILLIVLIPVQILRARRESVVLESKFGESYREYKRKTWF